MTIGALLLPDTPNSLIERAHREQAKAMLQKVRSKNDVDEEFQDLIEASESAMLVENACSNIIQEKYRPQLVMAIAIPFFQQLTGISMLSWSMRPCSSRPWALAMTPH